METCLNYPALPRLKILVTSTVGVAARACFKRFVILAMRSGSWSRAGIGRQETPDVKLSEDGGPRLVAAKLMPSKTGACKKGFASASSRVSRTALVWSSEHQPEAAPI